MVIEFNERYIFKNYAKIIDQDYHVSLWFFVSNCVKQSTKNGLSWSPSRVSESLCCSHKHLTTKRHGHFSRLGAGRLGLAFSTSFGFRFRKSRIADNVVHDISTKVQLLKAWCKDCAKMAIVHVRILLKLIDLDDLFCPMNGFLGWQMPLAVKMLVAYQQRSRKKVECLAVVWMKKYTTVFVMIWVAK